MTQLLGRADVKALRLKPVEVEAYTAVILDTDEPRASRRSRRRGAPDDPAAQGPGRDRRHRRCLDRDAAVASASSRAPRHPSALASSPHCRRSISPRRHQRRSRALRRAPIGGRAPTDEGRERAKQLADAALTLAPDSPDAHEVMGDLLIDASETGGRGRRVPEGAARRRLRRRYGRSSPKPCGCRETLTRRSLNFATAIKLEPRFARAHSGLGLALQSAAQSPGVHCGVSGGDPSRSRFDRRAQRPGRRARQSRKAERGRRGVPRDHPHRSGFGDRLLQPGLCAGGSGSGRRVGGGAPRSDPDQPESLQRALQPRRAVSSRGQVRRIGEAVSRVSAARTRRAAEPAQHRARQRLHSEVRATP